MATISEALAIAVQHHQAGRLQAAEQIYRQVLQADPNQADAIHLLGVLAHQTGRHEVAVETIRRAIKLNRTAAAFHSNLGEAYRALRRMPEAVACCRRAVELKPDYAEAHNNLGLALQDQGKTEKAVASLRRALKLRPDYAEAHNSLGIALQKQAKLEEAVASYRRALELKPDHAEAAYNLGNALKDQGKLDEAVSSYRRAVELKLDYADAHNNLANALWELGKLDEAVPCYRRALELKPEHANAYNNLGNALKDQGYLDDALACYRRAVELKPDYADAHSNLLLTLQYCADVTPAALAEAHAEYDRRHAAGLESREWGAGSRERGAGSRERGEASHGQTKVHPTAGRLRLGFVSSDLRRHPVGYFLVRALENLSREQHEMFFYSDQIVKDDLTTRIQATATVWRGTQGMSDQQLAEQIRADRIDILFDLAGHTAHTRLLVFARKPAPLQVTWIGYEGTTGLAAMDCLLADRHVVVAGSEQYYRERVVRLPDGYLCFDPPSAAPSVGPLPAFEKGYATFGSFNNLAKITPQVAAVWADILHRAPTARLILKYRGLGEPTVQRRYLDLFAACDVAPPRLELLPATSYTEYLATYHQVDVALDPFPFSGSATTCEALWMGVPVVTCPGETFASRHSLSHLSSVGLTETIAGDLSEYVELAVSLASDLPRLAGLRGRLREQMAASPLCDGKRFAANLTSTLHNLWEEWTGHGNHS